MMAVLSYDEIKEAVKEWMVKRGLPEPKVDNMEFMGAGIRGATEIKLGILYVQVRGVEMPVKEGPYR